MTAMGATEGSSCSPRCGPEAGKQECRDRWTTGSEVLWSLMAAVAGRGSWAQAVFQPRHIRGRYRHRAPWAGFLRRVHLPGPAGDCACVSSPSHWVNYKYIKFPALQRTEGGVPAGARDLPSGTPSVGRNESQKEIFSDHFPTAWFWVSVTPSAAPGLCCRGGPEVGVGPGTLGGCP